MDNFLGDELWSFPAGGVDELGLTMQRSESELIYSDAFPENLAPFAAFDNFTSSAFLRIPRDSAVGVEQASFAVGVELASFAVGGSQGLPQDSAVEVEPASFAVGGSEGLPQDSAVGVEQASFAVGATQGLSQDSAVGVEQAFFAVGATQGLPQHSAVGIEQASFAVGASQGLPQDSAVGVELASFVVGSSQASLVILQDPAVGSQAAGAVDYAAVEFACEGENGAMEKMDSEEGKRKRRKQSNRESARRSRIKWTDQFSQLASQADQLRLDNAVIAGLVAAIIQKYDKSAVENTVLKANVRALKAELKLAEAELIRVTGLIPVFDPLPGISAMNVPSIDASPSGTSMDAAVPMKDDGPDHPFY
ncbi:bZIP transcription factor RISBZ2-like [Hibiscus syriacus]|uniref:bZIP transcription factor RISBZ2-like n=1 Tax=Hibiscus syriacus TaxID=106335 RepID=UPI001923BBA6|nr:bZIP transcription factor RISBZ2-like [Hibiscus syriacus]